MRTLSVFIFLAIAVACRQPAGTTVLQKNCYPADSVQQVRILFCDTTILGRSTPGMYEDSLRTIYVLKGLGFVRPDGSTTHKPLKVVTLSGYPLKRFLHIFRTMELVKDATSTTCIPIYRHVVQFYNSSDSLVGQAFICFGCQQVDFWPEAPCLRDFDDRRLPELRAAFDSLGVPLYER